MKKMNLRTLGTNFTNSLLVNKVFLQIVFFGGEEIPIPAVATPMIIVVHYYCELEDYYLFYFYANYHSQVVVCLNVT